MKQVGFLIDHGGLSYPNIVRLAKVGEELGFDSVSLYDHFYPPEGAIGKDLVLETWSLLPSIALNTSKVKIMPLVTNNLFRHPGVLAKMAASLDCLSGGRLVFGIGAGWFRKEAIDFGYTFPSVRARMDMLEEATQVILKLWTEESASFHGKHYNLENAESLPKPVQKPHPAVLIGGKGEKRLLSIVAKYADISNFTLRDLPPQECKRLLSVLEEHCRRVGRDYDAITKTISGLCFLGEDESSLKSEISLEARRRELNPQDFLSLLEKDAIFGTPGEVRDRLLEYEEAGIDGVMLRFNKISQGEKAALFSRLLSLKQKRK